jgi:hypothetical protein
MKKKSWGVFLLTVLVFGVTTHGLASPPGIPDRPTREQRERVRERVKAMRMWKLTQALDLDDTLASRLFPLLNKYDKKRMKAERKIREETTALREALKTENEARLQSILERVEGRHKALQQLKDEEMAELKNILTTEQRARFILFQAEFQRDLRKIFTEARRKQRPDGGGGRPPF